MNKTRPIGGISNGPNFHVSMENGTPTFHLYDDIGPEWLGMISAEEVTAELAKVAGAANIVVRINSGGGDVFEANGIYNALRRCGAKVTVEVDALAASAASIIAMAGDKICMAANSMMMIHNAWTVTAGNKEDHAKAIDVLGKVDQTLCNTYCARTGLAADVVKGMMEAETWMNAQECVAKGFANEISQPLNVSAVVARGRFKNTPERFAPASTVPAPAPAPLPAAEAPAPADAKPVGATRLDLLRLRAEIVRQQIDLLG